MSARGTLGPALRALRGTAGMTLEDVSTAAGVSLSYLSRAEDNHVSPSGAWWSLVADAIGERLAGSKLDELATAGASE